MPNQPDQERTTAYRDSSGPESRSDAHCATIVGDWEQPSGESRLRQVMRRIIVAAAMLIAFMATARADFQDGVAAYKRGDYATALREWRPLAEQGYAGAQYNLGFMYYNGQGEHLKETETPWRMTRICFASAP